MMSRDRIIDRYQIGEHITITMVVNPGLFDGKPVFYVDGRKKGYFSFEAAIVGALALKYDGMNTQADRLICKMLGISGAE